MAGRFDACANWLWQLDIKSGSGFESTVDFWKYKWQYVLTMAAEALLLLIGWIAWIFNATLATAVVAATWMLEGLVETLQV